MLFNSYPFIFVFLPLALIGYQIAGKFHRKAVVGWLAFVSLAFYAYWRPALLYILISSIAVNYLSAALISRQIPNRIPSRIWLTLAIILDLSALGYYKYLFPSLNFLSSITGSGRHWADIVLPLGISFFTFTQIAFLVDLHQGIAQQQDFISYVLFVTFFPHLVAGPILHHKEMMPQFQQNRRYSLDVSDLAVGFSWFVMGAAKKVLLADNFGQGADYVFNSHQTLSASAAWVGSLAYCLQLYFDFSGYSDMALGLARMFSIDFPLNFNSPFKSASIIEFWQRWHITLSNYIMSYLYTPVQRWASARRQDQGKKVSRKAMATPGGFTSLVAMPMMFTLFIAGVWHGAGFQFMMYGLLHGLYLVINHGWRTLTHKREPTANPSIVVRLLKHSSAVLLTFLCVLVSFIFFRSGGVGQALHILASMAGLHPHGISPFPVASVSRREATNGLVPFMLKIVAGLGFVWILPNTQEILSRYKPSFDRNVWEDRTSGAILRWSPSIPWAVALGILFMCVISLMENPSTFLYFQF